MRSSQIVAHTKDLKIEQKKKETILNTYKMLNVLLLSIGIITTNLPYIVTVSVDDQSNGGGGK